MKEKAYLWRTYSIIDICFSDNNLSHGPIWSGCCCNSTEVMVVTPPVESKSISGGGANSLSWSRTLNNIATVIVGVIASAYKTVTGVAVVATLRHNEKVLQRGTESIWTYIHEDDHPSSIIQDKIAKIEYWGKIWGPTACNCHQTFNHVVSV